MTLGKLKEVLQFIEKNYPERMSNLIHAEHDTLYLCDDCGINEKDLEILYGMKVYYSGEGLYCFT